MVLEIGIDKNNENDANILPALFIIIYYQLRYVLLLILTK